MSRKRGGEGERREGREEMEAKGGGGEVRVGMRGRSKEKVVCVMFQYSSHGRQMWLVCV